ncbi:MAG TPA: AraC family transcriptional regulator [Candidatus Limnocylindria bacterium]|nr:AraC family transcriptional regulator [Candidatus Limnocylindria bacterium]
MRSGHVRRGIASVHLLVGLAAEHGVGAARCLAGSGIRPERLEDPFAEIEAAQELVVVRNLVRHLGDIPGIGLEAGRRYRLTAYGIWGYALLSSRTLRSASEFGIRYLDLTFAFTRFRAERERGSDALRVVLDDAPIPPECRQFLLERDAAAAVMIQRDLFQRPVPLRRVAFRCPRPVYADRFAEIFPGPVLFGQPEHCVVIDAEWADQPLPQADERTARLCEAQCSELLGRRRARPRVSERVRQHLLRLGSPGGRSMEAVAAELAMAPRTLHRHLAAEDTSFRRLLDEVRQHLAEEMLAQQMTVDEVAERLGYAETSSFAHAFKRWKGISPGVYRRRPRERRAARRAAAQRLLTPRSGRSDSPPPRPAPRA